MAQTRTAPDEPLLAYILANQPPEHEELRRLRELTQRLPLARMQIVPEQGHFLALLIKLTGARRVLELGTFTGYSALAMALALPPDGRLVTCDVDVDTVNVGLRCWERSGVAEKIEVEIGPALVTLARLEAEGEAAFDLVFIDADKPSYDDYYEAALRLVRPGGLIVLDNMLRRGEVSDPCNGDASTTAVRALNAKIAADERVDRVLLPLADGITLARRRS